MSFFDIQYLLSEFSYFLALDLYFHLLRNVPKPSDRQLLEKHTIKKMTERGFTTLSVIKHLKAKIFFLSVLV